jgi:hypothetical protein
MQEKEPSCHPEPVEGDAQQKKPKDSGINTRLAHASSCLELRASNIKCLISNLEFPKPSFIPFPFGFFIRLR